MTHFHSEGRITEVIESSGASPSKDSLDKQSANSESTDGVPRPEEVEEGREGAFDLESIEEDVLEGVIERIGKDPEAAERLGASLIHQAEFFRGPIPPPSIMEAYAAINPDLPLRIVQMAEQEQQGQLRIAEAKVAFNQSALEGEIRRVSSGQKYGAFIAVVALISATICAVVGESAAAIVIGGTTVISLVAAFVIGRLPELKGTKSSAKRRPGKQVQDIAANPSSDESDSEEDSSTNG